jgi:hypothetical protein
MFIFINILYNEKNSEEQKQKLANVNEITEEKKGKKEGKEGGSTHTRRAEVRAKLQE